MKKISLGELTKLLADIEKGHRHFLALAGPPGSGKSTLAEQLKSDLNAKAPGYAAILPMDGFHLDDRVLIQRGLPTRKGSQETFDIDGFVNMLARLRSGVLKDIAVPVFDRSLEIARAGARIISQSVRLVIVEGNYLLLDRDGWDRLSFDTTVVLVVPREILRQRLIGRWLQLAKTREEINLQVDGNDMINADLVQNSAYIADFFLEQVS